MKNFIFLSVIMLMIVSCKLVESRMFDRVSGQKRIDLRVEINYSTKINGKNLYKKIVKDAAGDATGDIVIPKKTDDGQFFDAGGIASDASGDIFVADNGNHRIEEFAPDGKFLSKWVSGGKDDKFNFDRISGMAFDSRGNLYIVDAESDSVQKLDDKGNLLIKWGGKGTGDGMFDSPSCITIDGSDNIYVCDTGNCRIEKFSTGGKFILKWGGKGSGDSLFTRPSGIAADAKGNIYVSDSTDDVIKKFDQLGNFLGKCSGDESGFSSPSELSIDMNGNIYVISGNAVVVKLDPDFKHKADIGGSDKKKQLDYPLHLMIGRKGNLYVTDGYIKNGKIDNNSLKKFDASGDLTVVYPLKKIRVTEPDTERKQKYDWVSNDLEDGIVKSIRAGFEDRGISINKYDASSDVNDYILNIRINSYNEGEYNLIKNIPSEFFVTLAGVKKSSKDFFFSRRYSVKADIDYPTEKFRVNEAAVRMSGDILGLFGLKAGKPDDETDKGESDATSDN